VSSSSPDSTPSASMTQSPLTTSDEVDLIMTYYDQTSQSWGEDLDEDTSQAGSDQNEAIISYSGETHVLLEQGRLKQEQKRLEQARLEQEQEQERLEQEEKRQEQEEKRLEQVQKRQEQEQARLEQEQEEKRQEQERLKKERLKKERLEGEKRQIDIKIKDGLSWRHLATLYPRDTNEVETYIKNNMRNGFRAFNTELKLLAPRECHKAVIDDKTHTILLVNGHGVLATDDEMKKSAAEIGAKAIERTLGLKPATTSDIART
jgi:flagellar biosynthesis GTPase FlhF